MKHLRFEDMGPNTLKASWDSADGKVLGYRVRCRRQTGPSSLISVSPQVHSVLLTDLAAGTTNKVCVKPVYKDQAGKGLCRMVHMQPGELGTGHGELCSFLMRKPGAPFPISSAVESLLVGPHRPPVTQCPVAAGMPQSTLVKAMTAVG